MGLNQNTWKLNQWYDQDVAGNVSYSGLNSLWAWGNNATGRLGINSVIKHSSPVQIPGTTWSSLEVGYDINSNPVNMGALKSDGTLWRWGINEYGELGQNNRTNYSSPVQVGSWTDWAASSFGMTAWGGVRTDGTLWMSGSNSGPGSYGADGQLGQNNTTSYSSPVQVPGTTWSTEIHGGRYNWIVIKTDGTLWTWGEGNYGALAQNSKTDYSSPVQVGTDADWSKVGIGWGSASAIKTDGTLWSWGWNDGGELGFNNRTEYSSPKQVPGTWSYWSSTRDLGSGGIKTDGTLWTCGPNGDGQLGLNNRTQYSSPVQVGSGTDWSKVITGYKSLGLKTDGTLWAWGYNSAGGLGQNQANAQLSRISSPVQVPGYWIDISAGAASAIAIRQA